MKTVNPQSAAANPTAASIVAGEQHSLRDRKSEGEKEKKFGSALDKKAQERRGVEKQAGADSTAEGPSPLHLAFLASQPPVSVAETGSAAAACGAVPPTVEAIHSEIVYAIEAAGPNEIRIEFDSQVLDGLSIALTREGGMLQVSMQVNSPEMARFLEAHASTLAQRLDRPEQPAFISIETRSAPRQDGGGYQQGSGQQPDRNPDSEDARDRDADFGDGA
ncbi:MAG: hypothetical protein KIT83_11295 [Bryobacterales bacterium]|nr:hypothetical protein [Bryobacterales bacterium]